MSAARRVVVSAVVTLLSLGSVAACGHGDDRSNGAGPTSSATSTSPPPSPGARIEVAGRTALYHGTEDVSGTGRATIDMVDGYFSPTVLTGKPGQKLELTLRNRGETPHHFTTADQQLIVEVQPGMTAEGRVTLPASGNLSFYCTLHGRHGMAGAFHVSGSIAAPGPEATSTD